MVRDKRVEVWETVGRNLQWFDTLVVVFWNMLCCHRYEVLLSSCSCDTTIVASDLFLCPLLLGPLLWLHRLILDMGPPNRYVPNFAISGYVIQKRGRSAPWDFLSPPSLLCQLIWNFTDWYKTLVRTIAQSSIFLFPVIWYRNEVKIMTHCSTVIIGLMDLKLHRVKLDKSRHDYNISKFSNPDHATQQWDQQ